MKNRVRKSASRMHDFDDPTDQFDLDHLFQAGMRHPIGDYGRVAVIDGDAEVRIVIEFFCEGARR